MDDEAWARRIKTLGLSSLALLLLDVAGGLGVLGSHALLMIQPLASGIVDDAVMERTIAFLSSPDSIRGFKRRLSGEET
jgi:hypothetical protein